MIPFRAITAATALLVATAGAANATQITTDPGRIFDGSDLVPWAGEVASNRDDPDDALDPDPAFYSLGLGGTKGSSGLSATDGTGGTFTIDVSPDVFGPNGSLWEFTFGSPNDTYPESARILADGQPIGEVVNDGTISGFPGGGATILGDTVSFSFTLPTGNFNTLTIQDTTWENYADVYVDAGRASDGFDIRFVDFDARAADVPVPATLGLLGAGLIGLGLAARRRRTV